ncbi:MAG: uncharacterized protein A8A55_1455 [Amphiamblys sp. WSBS2006]|nr:MAG: uncharacterized protein A8A55_1455 [Amphiamblys sp. WSBS2006]
MRGNRPRRCASCSQRLRVSAANTGGAVERNTSTGKQAGGPVKICTIHWTRMWSKNRHRSTSHHNLLEVQSLLNVDTSDEAANTAQSRPGTNNTENTRSLEWVWCAAISGPVYSPFHHQQMFLTLLRELCLWHSLVRLCARDPFSA